MHAPTQHAEPTPEQVAEFTAHYIAAGLQLSDDELGPNATRHELAPADAAHISADCAQFLAAADSTGLVDSEFNFAQAGTDYWLTRNGHGAGFWDRPEVYGDTQAEDLTALCKKAGPMDFQRGDDGRIYCYPPVSFLAQQ